MIKLVHRQDFLLGSAEGKRVLHLGCTNHPYTSASLAEGSLLHTRLAEAAREIVGFDSDSDGLELLRERGLGAVYQADLEELDSVPLNRTFDVIIAGEVIEHLSNPGRFLHGVQRFMEHHTKLVLTTVNAYSGMRFAQYALRGKGGISEPVHPDHVAYYSYKTLALAIDRAGLSMDQFAFYDLGPEHRIHNRRILNLINDLSVWLTPQLADGVIAVCSRTR